jgi:ABC-type antimicrobial peptide transport system permease subunit
VVGQGLRLTATGLVIGVVLALAMTRFLAALLYGVRPTEPTVFLGVAVLLLAVAAIASFAPARTAMRLDPAVVLREE